MQIEWREQDENTHVAEVEGYTATVTRRRYNPGWKARIEGANIDDPERVFPTEGAARMWCEEGLTAHVQKYWERRY
jgi:hypothetical protein